jgi:hypothetical protein
MKRHCIALATALLALCAHAQDLSIRRFDRTVDPRQTQIMDKLVWYAGESIDYVVRARAGQEIVDVPPGTVPVWTVLQGTNVYLIEEGSVPTLGTVAIHVPAALTALPPGQYTSWVQAYAGTNRVGVLDRANVEVRWRPGDVYTAVEPLTNVVDQVISWWADANSNLAAASNYLAQAIIDSTAAETAARTAAVASVVAMLDDYLTAPDVDWGIVGGDPADNAALVDYVAANSGGSAIDSVARGGVETNAAAISLLSTGKLDAATAAATYLPLTGGEMSGWVTNAATGDGEIGFRVKNVGGSASIDLVGDAGRLALSRQGNYYQFLPNSTQLTYSGGPFNLGTNALVLGGDPRNTWPEGGSGWTNLAFAGTGNVITSATATATTLTLQRGTVEGGGGTAISTNASVPTILSIANGATGTITRGTASYFFIDLTNATQTIRFDSAFDATVGASLLIEMRGTNSLTVSAGSGAVSWADNVWLRDGVTVPVVFSKPYAETNWVGWEQ